MEQSFESLLERCLQSLARGEDLEDILERNSRHAEQLRPLLELAQATAAHYVGAPDPPGGLEGGRERLLAAAQRLRLQAPQPERRREPMRVLSFVRAAVASLVVVAVVGTGTVLAAGGALPGEALYPVKIAYEDLRLSMASSPTRQVDLALQFAAQRALEIQELAENDNPVPAQVMNRLEQSIQFALQAAAAAPEDEMPGLLSQIRQSMQLQIQTLGQAGAMTATQTRSRIQLAQQACQQADDEAAAGIGDPQTFRYRHQIRESQPESASPPEPPEIEPPGGESPQGDQQQNQQGTAQQGNDANEPQGTQEQNQTSTGEGTSQGAQEQNQQGTGSETPSPAQEMNGPATPQGQPGGSDGGH